MFTNKLPQRKGQGVLEYLLLCGIVGFVAILSFAPNGLLNKVGTTSKSYSDTITSVIQGKNPKAIDGGWCDWVFYPSGGERYRSCECPAPAFGGDTCVGNHKEGACGATGTCFTFTPEYAACPNECGTKESTLSPISCTRSDGAIGFPPSNCHGKRTCPATNACFTYEPEYAPCPTACGTLDSTLSPISCKRSDGQTGLPTNLCSGSKFCDATAPCPLYTPVYASPCPSVCGKTVSQLSPISCTRSDGQSGFTPNNCPVIKICPATDPCPTFIPAFAECPKCGSSAQFLSPISCTRSDGVTGFPTTNCSGLKYCGPTEACYTYIPVYEACPGSCGTDAVSLSPISCTRKEDGVTGLPPSNCPVKKFCPKTDPCPTYSPVYPSECPQLCGYDASTIQPTSCFRDQDKHPGFPPSYCPVPRSCVDTGFCPWTAASCNASSCGYGSTVGSVCSARKCNASANPNGKSCKNTWGCTGQWQVSGCSSSCGWGTTSVLCVGGPCDPDTKPASGNCKGTWGCTGYWKDNGCSKTCGGGVKLSICINGPCDPDTMPQGSCNTQACITYTPVYPACSGNCGWSAYKNYPISCKGSDGKTYPKENCYTYVWCPGTSACVTRD